MTASRSSSAQVRSKSRFIPVASQRFSSSFHSWTWNDCLIGGPGKRRPNRDAANGKLSGDKGNDRLNASGNDTVFADSGRPGQRRSRHGQLQRET